MKTDSKITSDGYYRITSICLEIISGLLGIYFLIHALVSEDGWHLYLCSLFFISICISLHLKITSRKRQDAQRKDILDAHETATTLVDNYAKVLSDSGNFIMSERELPASKDKIKAAIISNVKLFQSLGSLDNNLFQLYRTAYCLLANFVPHDDYIIAKKFLDIFSEEKFITGLNNISELEVIAKFFTDNSEDYNHFINILQNSTKESKMLLEEFDSAIKFK